MKKLAATSVLTGAIALTGTLATSDGVAEVKRHHRRDNIIFTKTS